MQRRQVLLGTILTLTAYRAAAQTPPSDPATFLTYAVSSAVMQARASELASVKDVRMEVKAFASEMVRFRAWQLDTLRAAAQARNVALPDALTFEHRVIVENLEPLDYLAFSRRYAEVVIQALTQEIQAYEAASRGADDNIRVFASQTLPLLGQQLDSSLKLYDVVKP